MISATLQNRYRLEAELGQGGMGIVYRAHDTLLNRPVAVKVLSATGLGTAGKARLLAEAQAAAKLNHPNIVNVYDAGETEGRPFIVMELVEGEPLRQHQPQTLGDALILVRQICAALEHAHANGIIHRDLKPENIVLTKTQTVKLMDFGLARMSEGPRLTEEGTLVGTMSYLAPELIQGQRATVQSDLYALGVMLYELTTGRPPFTGDNLAVLLSQHVYAEPASPRAHNPDISPDLDALILQLLHKQPADRPTSAAEVAQALGHMLPTPALSALLSSRATAPTTNLPTQLSKFVGREKEIAQLKKRLAENRLVTLTGSGGVGKTRLAIQVASELLSEFPHGAWLVDLASLADPALVPQTAATVLDVKPQGNQPVLAALSDYLRAKKLLLVLDNCEHLIEACAQLAESLLRTCPDLRLLTTSREALGVEGEATVRVPSLSLPSSQNTTFAAIAEAEAVQLFVERAAAALPGFTLTEANAPTVAQVCRRLDGIALAIELAASRVKLLKVEQIAARLDDAFRFLTGGSRTALPRQQTLRATIDWSYTLLSELERRLLCRLSVFAGGWTLEAAEAVCAGQGIEPYGILDLLTQLVNKSLVAAEREQGEEARYRLLETIREYALERLAASGESENIRREHARFFLGLAQEAEPHLTSAARGVWLERLKIEHDNLRAALQRASESGEALTGLQLATALHWFCYLLGYLSEGRSWLEGALAQATILDAPAARAKALSGAGNLAWFQGEYTVARSMLEESITISRALGPPGKPNLAYALLWLGLVTRDQGDPAAARSLLEESVAICREIGDRWMLALALVSLGRTVTLSGDPAAARSILEEGGTIYREIRDKWGLAVSRNNLGLAALREGDYIRAVALYQEGVTLFWQVGEKVFAARCLEELAWAVSMQGDYGRATRLFGVAEAQREAFAVYMPPAARTEHDRNVAAARAQLGEATFDLAWAEGRALTMEQAIEYALEESESPEH